jgi:hypothetical protein
MLETLNALFFKDNYPVIPQHIELLTAGQCIKIQARELHLHLRRELPFY